MTACIDHGKIASVSKEGYLKVRYKGKVQRAHRVAYCEARQIPLEFIEGSVMRHTCDNSRCINPQHLVIGTHQDNVADRVARQRCAKQRGIDNGRAVLTPDEVRYIREHYKPRCKEFNGVNLARKFGVSAGLISAVAKGKKWAHTK